MNAKRIALNTFATLLALFLGYMAVGLESYCFVNPSIDTHYAAGFSESAFSRIKAGMTQAEVSLLLGAPLDIVNLKSRTRWQYTRDGKCRWADWAWLGRTVVFKEGRVVETEARVWYD